MGKGSGGCDRPALLLDTPELAIEDAPSIELDLPLGDLPVSDGGVVVPFDEAAMMREVERMQEMLRTPAEARLYRADEFIDIDVVQSLRNRITSFHKLTQHKLDKRAFEYALRDAFTAAGLRVAMPRSATHAGHDLEVNGKRLSLKTETPRDDRLVNISKLMEASEVVSIRTKTGAAAFVPHVLSHLSRYDQIVTLRSTEKTDDDGKLFVDYELVEVPIEILAAAAELTPKNFRKSTKGASARVNVGGEWAYTLRLDGSVGKVSVLNLRKDLCKLMATFRAPLDTPLVDDGDPAAAALRTTDS